MRRIDFIEPTDTAWRKWRVKCDTATRECVRQVQRGRDFKVSGLYRQQKNHFRDVDGPFLGKCAYCEQKISGNQNGDVEHYRPKKSTLNLDWSPVRIQRNGRMVPHPGYYWLAYDWKNLLFSCVLCNQVSAKRTYGKGSRFPVIGKHATRPGAEVDETPLLLNPCFDDPAAHLSIDETGVLVGRTRRGKVTVDVLGLNERDLPKERSQKYQSIEEKFYYILGRQREHNAAWFRAEIDALESEKGAFTLAAKAAVNSAKQYVRSLLSTNALP